MVAQGEAAAGATTARDLLRHTVATLAYRGGKALRRAPAGFADFRPYPSSRAAGEVLAHMSDLLDWALSLARGQEAWRTSAAQDVEAGEARFFAALEALDAYLASDAALGTPAERIFQGPIADALTHVGQVAMMRRMAGLPIVGEDYQRADIAIGRVGRDQARPRAEFR
jgi:hypothetical protein